MFEHFNWKRLCLIGVSLSIVVLLLYTYHVKVYVGDTSVKYTQILEYLENNFEGLDFELGTKLFNNSTTDYYDCLNGVQQKSTRSSA